MLSRMFNALSHKRPLWVDCILISKFYNRFISIEVFSFYFLYVINLIFSVFKTVFKLFNVMSKLDIYSLCPLLEIYALYNHFNFLKFFLNNVFYCFKNYCANLYTYFFFIIINWFLQDVLQLVKPYIYLILS